MRRIEIPNFPKYQHYRDRRPPWIKLLVEIIDEFDADGNAKKFYHLADSAKLTFLLLLALRSRFTGFIPFKSEKWLKQRLGIKSLNLQPLVNAGFITVRAEVEHDASTMLADCYKNAPPETETETYTKETETYISAAAKANFELARKLWPGKKRGLDTEYGYFCKQHADGRSLLEDDGLAQCIQAMIDRKAYTEGFWPHFSKCIHQRLWEIVT